MPREITERADWVEAKAFYLLRRHLSAFGLAPTLQGEISSQDAWDQFSGFLRLRFGRIDGTTLGQVYVRLMLEDASTGRRRLSALALLALRFPISVAGLAASFFICRGSLLLRAELPRAERQTPQKGVVEQEQRQPAAAQSLENQAFQLLTQYLRECGVLPLPRGDVLTHRVRRLFDDFLRLRREKVDGTQLGVLFVRMAILKVKNGKRTPISLIPIAFRLPRSMALLILASAKHRRTLLLNWSWQARPPRNDATSVEKPAPTREVTAAPANPSSGAAMQVLKKRPAPIVARCFDCWGDLDDAISYLTPGGGGIWGNVAFVRETAFPPDWHVVLNSIAGNAIDLEASPNRMLFAIGEPPTPVHRILHEGQGSDTIVLTCDEQLVRLKTPPRRYIMSPPITRTWAVRKTYDWLRTTRVCDKPRQLSWITSNQTVLKGHRYRLAFLRRMKRKVEFDLFGRGFRPLADKWDGLAPYRYSIAFENTQANHYFTEKLMDCFVAETMPLYYGCLDIQKFFPEGSIVRFDPEDPDALDRIKEVISSDLWQRNREAIREAKHLVLEKYNAFAYLAEVMEKMSDPPMPLRLMRIEPKYVELGVGH